MYIYNRMKVLNKEIENYDDNSKCVTYILTKEEIANYSHKVLTNN